MKVSLNWLKDYLDIDLPPEKIGEILTDIGLELEGMEEVESIKGGLEGILIGEVVECRKHPNADKLSLTRVNIGNGEPLHIVCGANNVAAGQKVLVATVGTTIHPNEGEPWTIKKGNIRGELSEGMICSEDEIGLGDDHAGIVVLPGDAPVGTLARNYFKVEKDYVFEIGLTPNRSDATNHIGVAKDLAAALRINYGHEGKVKVPSVENFKVDNHDLPVEVVVDNAEACPRYAGVSIQGVTVGESPEWLKKRLRAVGVRPISNIVDITNFVLHEFGQPLHAFDLDHVAGRKVIVRTLPEGSSFTTLDEVERKLSGEDLMICDGASKGMCIGGVFGGVTSGVKETTRDIFLESAHFNAKWIRRTSMRHNLRTDAAKVFEKGSDPNIAVHALKRAAMLMKELGGGRIASEVVDVYPRPIQQAEVEVSYGHVNRLIGMEIPREKITAILEALEMKVTGDNGTTFTVAIPTNKTDVTREADVIEEILRIYGLNNVPVPAQIRTSVALAPNPDPNRVRDLIGDYLAANGFHEMMAISFSESRYYKDYLPGIDPSDLVWVNNTSNVHLDIMRPDMLMSGLEAILHNQNRRQLDLRLFEFGKTYRYAGQSIDERYHLSLFLYGLRWDESWRYPHDRAVDFFTIKSFAKNILQRLGLAGYQESVVKDEVFAYALKCHRGEQTLVTFGKVNAQLTRKMDIRGEVFYADFQWDNVMKALKKQPVDYKEISKFPSVRRDLALIIENSIKFDDIVAIARKLGKKLIKEINLFDVYENEEQLGAGKKSYAVSFLFEDPEKTLKDKEVDQVIAQLIDEYEQKLGAVIRR
jgi:phenylalanyl-tRNA synthetase beta chain